MKPGNVVEYATDDEHRLGAVVKVIGKTKLAVVTATGDENRPERDDVTFTLAGSFDPEDRSAATKAVARVEMIVTGLQAKLDLAEVWAVAGTGIDYDLQGLARASGDGSGMAQIALARLLREDDVYFRQRKGRIEARSVGQVEERLRQLEAQSEQMARRDEFVDAVTDVLALPLAERASRYEEVVASDPVFAELAELLAGFAADESGFPRREEAEALMEKLARAADLRLSAHAAPRGFELMRQLGLWSQHEILSVHRFGVPMEHDGELLELSRAAVRDGFDREGREDFTGWWSLTIDDVDATDADDGLSIRPTLDGGWEIAVHIADPDAYAPIGSPLDDDAQRRGASIYLPDRVVGMFDAELTRAMSLVPDEERPALTTHVVLDQNLDVVEFRIAPSIVQMNRRLSYEEADSMLDGTSNDHTASVLRDLAFVADELHARRMDAGARSVELPKPCVRVSFEDGEPTIELEREDPSPARNLIAEFMVWVGQLTARWCVDNDVPIIFRAQQRPHTERADDAIARVPAGWPREMAVLMTMQRAAVSTSPAPHAGLGFEMYAQATSPIRRYGDLVVQRQIRAALRDEPLPYDSQELHRLAHLVDRANDEVGQVQNEAETYWLLEAMRRREGEEVEAMVVMSRGEGGKRVEVILLESGYRTRVRLREPVELGTTLTFRIDRAQPRRPSLTLEPA